MTIGNLIKSRIAATLVLACLSIGSALAEPTGLTAQADSILLPPKYLPLYEKSFSQLNPSEQWRVRIHGLRLAPLHPAVWGIRRSEKTENRRLVPIRPFYLRASEDKDFVVESINLLFSFKKVAKEAASRNYHDKDSVFDVGFSGRYREGLPLAGPLEDTSYVLRLTAFDDFISGLYFRSQTKHVLVKEAAVKSLETNLSYSLSLSFQPETVTAVLNGQPFMQFRQESVNKGLIYLITSWNAINLDQLEVKGYFVHNPLEQVSYKGLVPVSESGETK